MIFFIVLDLGINLDCDILVVNGEPPYFSWNPFKKLLHGVPNVQGMGVFKSGEAGFPARQIWNAWKGWQFFFFAVLVIICSATLQARCGRCHAYMIFYFKFCFLAVLETLLGPFPKPLTHNLVTSRSAPLPPSRF